MPEASAVVVAIVTPLKLNFTVVPVPFAAGVIEPETLKTGIAVIVNVATVKFALLTVAGAEVGLKVKPLFVGVTV